MFAQRLLALMHNLPGFRVVDPPLPDCARESVSCSLLRKMLFRFGQMCSVLVLWFAKILAVFETNNIAAPSCLFLVKISKRG